MSYDVNMTSWMIFWGASQCQKSCRSMLFHFMWLLWSPLPMSLAMSYDINITSYMTLRDAHQCRVIWLCYTSCTDLRDADQCQISCHMASTSHERCRLLTDYPLTICPPRNNFGCLSWRGMCLRKYKSGIIGNKYKKQYHTSGTFFDLFEKFRANVHKYI